MSDSNTSGSDWKFQTGDLLTKPDIGIRDPTGSPIGSGGKYRVKRRLTDSDSGERFYYFDLEHDRGRHLMAASVVERDWKLHPDT
jgi:hypothetical protein